MNIRNFGITPQQWHERLEKVFACARGRCKREDIEIGVDLGLGGALVDTAPGFEIGEIVTFRCLSFGIHGRLEAESKIVKIKEMNEDYGTYALEFQNLDAATTKLLGRYVVDLLKLGRSPRKR